MKASVKPIIIGITGVIGSGKSTAARYFKECGYKIIEADKVAHELYKSNPDIRKRLVNEFGAGILKITRYKTGEKIETINRKKLAEIVFNNYRKLKKINTITHPCITNATAEKIKKFSSKHHKIAVVAFEFRPKYLGKLVKEIILIQTTQKNILERLPILKKHIATKFLNEQKTHQNADFHINNNGTINDLQANIRNISSNISSNISPKISKRLAKSTKKSK